MHFRARYDVMFILEVGYKVYLYGVSPFVPIFAFSLTLIYPAHFEDVPCQSGVNHIFEG